MKVAILSDLHSNIQALEACLAHAREHGAQAYVFLGDLVGYGADPVAVLERVKALQNQGARVVCGNHDRMALTPPKQGRTEGEAGAAWTHAQLSEENRAFLRDLPLTLTDEDVLFVHASALAPERWHYVEEERAAARSLDAAVQAWGSRYVFGGHVHRQTLYYEGTAGRLIAFTPQPGVAVPVPAHRRWIATVGSVGQPRDGDTRAMYALFDRDHARLTFHRVAYDHLAAAEAIRRSALPARYAQRLLEGT